MARKAKRPFDSDQVFGGASDLAYTEKPPQKDLSIALFDVMDQAKTIDSFEEAAGIVKKKEVKPKDHFKSTILDLDKVKDRELLEKLMNDPRYKIMSWEKNWSSLGRLRAFVIYSDTQVEDNKKSNE